MLKNKPPKPKSCKVCRTSFMPKRPFEVWCSPDCALVIFKAKQEKKAKAEKAAERKADREKLDKLKPISKLEEECRAIVQRMARIRDKDDGCISCHMGPNYTGIWHGSHYRAHGGCSSLQFHLWNIHKACEQCNYFKGGNKEGFIAGLLKKPGYGRERIDWLDCQPKSKKFTREYLHRFKRVMSKRCRRMEKRAG